ncbi:MAG TPA: hypothetical protein PKC36_13660 [Dietzia sp.]|jgi:hypothetical protein|nr:hypothetical protein [Dietzia sp.]
MASTTATRTNTYAGTCSECGERVAAAAGLLGPKVDGRWTVRHADCQPQVTTYRSAAGVTYTVGMTRRPVNYRRERAIDRAHRADMARYGIDE